MRLGMVASCAAALALVAVAGARGGGRSNLRADSSAAADEGLGQWRRGSGGREWVLDADLASGFEIDMRSVAGAGPDALTGSSLLQAAARRAMAAPSSPGVRHMHNVSLMLEKAVVFGSDRLFLWPIRVPPGTAALTVEGVLVQQRDSAATPVLLLRTGGRVPTTENFDAAEAFLPPLAETVQEARAEAAAAAAKARQDTLADTGNATAAEDAATAAATAAIDAEASSVGSGTGSAHARATARVVLHGQSDTVFAAVWGGRALFSNTYPQTSHTRDVSVRLRARAEVCSPPTAPSDGDCLRVGSGVFLLPGVSGSHKVEDLSGGLAWTFTLVGAVPGLQASPDKAVQDITIPRFTSAMTITLARWKDASDARLSVRIRAEACVQGAAGAEDGEGLDRPVTMTATCDSDGWEVASVTADKAGQTRSVTVLLPRAGRWIAVASLAGPTEDLDPNPVTAAVTVTTYTVARSAASGAGVLFSDAERTLASPTGAAGAAGDAADAHGSGSGSTANGTSATAAELDDTARVEAEARWRAAEAAAKAARHSGRAAPGWPFSLDAGTTATQGLTQDFASPSDSAAMFKLTRAGGDVATIADLRRAAADHGTSGDSATPRMRETASTSAAALSPRDGTPAGMVGPENDGAAPTDVSWSMHTLSLPDWSGSGFMALRLLLNATLLRPATATVEHPGCRPLRVFMRRGGMPLAYHLDVPGHARVAAEDAGGKGAPVIAPADFTLAPENARVVKSVGAGFTELVWELERPPPGEWFVAIVHSPAGTDLVCEDVLSATDLAVMDEGLLAQATPLDAEAGSGSASNAEAEALAELAGGSGAADGASAGAGADASISAHPAGKSAGSKGRHGDSGAGPSDPDAEVVATATFTDGSGTAAGSADRAPDSTSEHDGGKAALRAGAPAAAALLQRTSTSSSSTASGGHRRVSAAQRMRARHAAVARAVRDALSDAATALSGVAVRSPADLKGAVRIDATTTGSAHGSANPLHASALLQAGSRTGSRAGSPMLGGVAMLGAVSHQPKHGGPVGSSAEPSPISPQTHPIGTPASDAGSAEASGSADSTSMSARASSGLMAIENTLSEELGEVMSLAKQYLAELGFSSGPDEADARRRAAMLYNPADRLYAISATLTACSAHCSGQCTLLRSEGYVAGQCVCTNPYRFAGDYCDEETGSVPFYSLSTGLLVLSNAAMLPAVLLALRWHLWGEAVVLAGAALSSALYHTCDQYLFCFSSTYHSLQAMDISGSYLAVTISLMLVAGLPQSARLAIAIALLAVFLFTLDNPASLGRAAGLAITVAVALFSLVAGLCYSVLRNFAAWSKVAARASMAEERQQERERRQLTAGMKSADATATATAGAGAGAGPGGDDDDADADLFDGDAIAAAFVGDDEPDSGAAFYGDDDGDDTHGSTAGRARYGSAGGRRGTGTSGKDPSGWGSGSAGKEGRGTGSGSGGGGGGGKPVRRHRRRRRATPCLSFVRSPYCCCGLIGCCLPDCCDPSNWSCSVFAAARFLAWAEDAARGWVAPSLARRSPRVARAAGLSKGTLLGRAGGGFADGDEDDFDDGAATSFSGTSYAATDAASLLGSAGAGRRRRMTSDDVEASAAEMQRALPVEPESSLRSRTGGAVDGVMGEGGGAIVSESGDEAEPADEVPPTVSDTVVAAEGSADGAASEDGEEEEEAGLAGGAGERRGLLSGSTGLTLGNGSARSAGAAPGAGAAGSNAVARSVSGRPVSGLSSPTHTPIAAPQAAPAWCTARARRALFGAAELLLFKSGNFRWKWIYTALGLFGVALLLVAVSTNGTYWVTHSLWHCAIMGVPAALILARVDPRGPLLVFDASARRRVGVE